MIADRSMIKVRKAQPNDGRALAGVFRDCWRNAYAGIIPHGHLEGMIGTRDKTWWQNAIRRESEILVLDVSSTVAGYATFGPSRGSRVYQGEIYELYLAPVYQGLGLGEHVFEACRQALDVRKFDGLIVGP